MSLPNSDASGVALIGLSQYTYLEDLPAVEANLSALQEFLTSPSGWNLALHRCITVLNPTSPGQVIEPIIQLSESSPDAFMVYYAGHGHLDEEMRFYLSLSDSRKHSPWTWLSYEWIKKSLSESQAKKRVAIIDSCFSGRALGVMSEAGDAVRVQAATSGTVVITSARDDRVSISPPGEEYTAFTSELLSVINNGIDGVGQFITADDAYSAIRSSLSSKGRPRPDKTGSDTAGRMAIASNRKFFAASNTGPDMTPFKTIDLIVREHLRSAASHLIDRSSPLITRRMAGSSETRYIHYGRLGAGGMASVIRAHDTIMNRDVVIKTFHKYIMDEGVDYHLLESGNAGALDHPTIGRIFDVKEGHDGSHIFMEYIRGISLDRLLESEHPPTICEALAITIRLLDGLEYAHSRGVIHCDIKPANIMLACGGEIKLIDFGISHLLTDPGDTPLREGGTMVGTPRYMDPELLADNTPRIGTDLYSVGVVLYELCTNTYPYEEDDAVYEILGSARSGEITPPSSITELPNGLEAVILKAMERRAADRFLSAAAMRSPLQEILSRQKCYPCPRPARIPINVT